MEKSSALMSIEQVVKILPHRFPFVMVDRVLGIVEGSEKGTRVGRTIRALKNVTVNEPFFPGHFPERPVMPGVLIIEAMAQAGALVCYKPQDPEMDVAIVSISDAKFRKPVAPGDSLVLTVKVLKDRGQMIVLGCEAHVDQQKVAEAEIMASMTPKAKS